MNAYIKFGEILTICSQDIERKWNYDGRNDGIKDGQRHGMADNPIQYSPTFSKRGYKKKDRVWDQTQVAHEFLVSCF